MQKSTGGIKAKSGKTVPQASGLGRAILLISLCLTSFHFSLSALAAIPFNSVNSGLRARMLGGQGGVFRSPISLFTDLFSRINHFTGQAPSLDPIDFLREKLSAFSGALPTTIQDHSIRISERASERGRRNARAFLKQEYEKLGYGVTFQSFTYGSVPGTNFIAERTGVDPTQTLIVSSHYDTVENVGGADDDGSGTISALAVAQSLSGLRLNMNVRFVAFDLEELGLYGSSAYADYLEAQGEMDQIQGVINLEMTGYNGMKDGGFHVIDCLVDPDRPENTSAKLSSAILASVGELDIALTRVPACTDRADHAVFWRHDKPSVTVSQNFFGGDANPCYHRRCDTVDLIDWNYMQKLTQATSAAVAHLLTTSI